MAHRRVSPSAIGAGLLIALGLGVALPAGALSSSPPTQGYDLHQVNLIKFAAPAVASTSYDISFVDPTTDSYYLADRTNAGIDAVSTLTDTFSGVIGAGQFVGATPTVTAAQTAQCGTSVAGPNGVLSLTIGKVHQVWGSDGVTATNPVSSVRVYSLTADGQSATGPATVIPTVNTAAGLKGMCRADEMAYDSRDHVFIVANPVDPVPYVTLISVNANPALDKVIGTVTLPGTSGIEQSQWDQRTDRFFTNVPGQFIAVINPLTATLETTYGGGTGGYATLPSCSASGLALDPTNQRLFAVCGVNPQGSLVVDALTGQLVSRVKQISGADEIWYDSGTNNVYFGANRLTSDETATAPPAGTGIPTPAIGVVNAGGKGLDKNLPVWLENVPEGATTNNNHSVAADPNNGQVFVPIAGAGIQVLTNQPRN